MPPAHWLNLDSLSVARLASLIVSLGICVTLFRIREGARPTRLLAYGFAGASAFNAASFLEYAGAVYWHPSRSMHAVVVLLQDAGPSIAALALVAFGYHFCGMADRDRKESRLLLATAAVINAATLVFACYDLFPGQPGRPTFWTAERYYVAKYGAVGAQFSVALFLLLRKSYRLSSGASPWRRLLAPAGPDARAARALAATLLLPLVAVLAYLLVSRGVLSAEVGMYVAWVDFVVSYAGFVVTYMNHTGEPTTFQVKIVGVVLVSFVAVLALAPMLAGRYLERDHAGRQRMSGQRTIRFTPNAYGSYDIRAVGYTMDPEPGPVLSLDEGHPKVIDLGFGFVFYRRPFAHVSVSHSPIIILGELEGPLVWGGYHPWPAIAPLLMDVDAGAGGAVHVKSEADRLTITWLRIAQPRTADEATVQLVLRDNGSFDVSYGEIRIVGAYGAARMVRYVFAAPCDQLLSSYPEASPQGPRLAGIHPGGREAALIPVDLERDLPYSSLSAGVLYQAYDIDFYRYLSERMLPFVLVLAMATLCACALLPVLLRTTIIRPLKRLHAGMQRVDEGDLEVRVTPAFNDEIGALSRYFNRMLQSIKESEAGFRALAETAQDGIMVLSPDGRIVYANQRAAAILRTTRSELTVYRLDDLIDYEEQHSLGGQDATPGREAVLRAIVAQGVHVELTRSRTVWGGKTAEAVIVRDVSLRRQEEQTARAQQQRMMQTDKLTSLGVLVAGVAHEVSNPNQSILSSIAVLRRAAPQVKAALEVYADGLSGTLVGGLEMTEFLRQYPLLTESIEKCCVRIDGIVQGLKSFSRSGSENLGADLDINEVVRSAVELLSYYIRRATHRFLFRPGTDVPRVAGDPLRLEQVFVNLLLNACQSLPDPSRGVEVHTEHDKDGDAALVVVRDQGRGIPQEHLGKVTEPFYTTRSAMGGTGLGLHVVKTIVSEHRGRLSISSEPGSGTVVTVTLPARRMT